MAYTCRQFVQAAFEEIGLASYIFDLQPEQLQSVLRRLDSMMADWNGKGIRLRYPIPNSPEQSNLEASTDVPDSANEAVISNLAVRIGPMFGKAVSVETKTTARESYNTLLSRAAAPVEMQLPGTMPAGAGNYAWSDNNYLYPPSDPVLTGPEGPLEF